MLAAGCAAVGVATARAQPADAAPPAQGPGLPALYVPWPSQASQVPPMVTAPAIPVITPTPRPRHMAAPATAPVPVATPPQPVAPPIAARPAPPPLRTATAIPAAMPAMTATPAASVAAAPPASAPISLPPAAAASIATAPVARPPAIPALTRPGEGIISHALLTPGAPPRADAVEAEAAEIRAALRRDVPGIFQPDLARAQSLLELAQAQWVKSSNTLDHAQLTVVVDRSPRSQMIALVLQRPDGPWEILGATHVSTGQAGRFDHYITPVGVFINTSDILGYRAEGTYNENHIRGYGVKGMRVWDFGWQTARKGWRSDSGEMRLEMHATDPEVLAQRIGRPASQGCVRIPAALNRFFDRFGVIDAEDERAAVDDVRFRALLLPGRTPTPLAGNALIIVDSSGQA